METDDEVEVTDSEPETSKVNLFLNNELSLLYVLIM